MRLIRGIAFVVLLVSFSCDTDKNVLPVFETFFTKYYGADGNQSAVDLLVNPDGTMVMLANTTSQISSIKTPYIVKVDNMGNVLWQRQLGMNNEEAKDIEPDGNGGLLILSNVLATGISRMRITNIDQNGRGIDSVSIENDGIAQTGISISRAPDGSLLVVGTAGPDFLFDKGPNGVVDQADLLVFRFASGIHDEAEPFLAQAGERIGQIVKGFQTSIPGPFYVFLGDSDRPFNEGGQYLRTFEIFGTDKFGIQTGPRPPTGIVSGELQVASSAIEIPGLSQDSYLLIGTSTIGSSSSMFIIQYIVNNFQQDGVVVRVNRKYDFNPRMEGTTAAVSPNGTMYLLGNVIQDNNKRDVILVKVNSEGGNESHKSFGALEGDDFAAAVNVLPDGRIAVVATIELETQKKIALFILSPDGDFVSN